MHEDHEGFLVPCIDNKKCCKCLLCQNSCHALLEGPQPKDRPVPKAFAFFVNDDNARVASASGGAFWGIARRWIEEGGAVVGAAYTQFPEVRHIVVTSVTELSRLQGSKYVYSDVRPAFKQIRTLLRSGQKVLFSGLPCQVAALYAYIGNVNLPNLLTVDLICHGIPPLKLFRRYVEFVQRTRKVNIIDYRFRTKKSCNWNDGATYRGEHVISNGERLNVPLTRNWYMRYFLGAISLRHACYACHYAKIPRMADVTLGDFWGIEKYDCFKTLYAKGVSLVLSNSDQAKKMLSELHFWQMGVAKEVPLAFTLTCNPQIIQPSKKNAYRRVVFNIAYLKSHTLVAYFDSVLFGVGRIAKRFVTRQSR